MHRRRFTLWMRIGPLLAVASAVGLSAQPAHAQNLLVNPDFEIPEVTSAGIPATPGDWLGDLSSIVTGTQLGIDPADGSRMLRCIATAGSEASGLSAGCQLWQLFDLSAFQSEISTGRALATASYRANRVVGDAETDTAFAVEIQAHTGSPAGFPGVGNAPEALASRTLETDADLATWETVTTSLLIPVGTDYLAFEINVIENVFNDASLPELDGHFVDGALLEIALAPGVPALAPWATLLLLASITSIGALGSTPLRRRK